MIVTSYILLLFNTNGLGEFKKRKGVFGFLCKQSANIFWLQNTLKKGAENLVGSEWGFGCIVAGPDCASKGVAVLLKNNSEYKIHHILKDDEGRYILIHTEMLNKRLTLANAYTQQWRPS